MARCKDPNPKNIPLAHPDRSAPPKETLIEWAESRNLFAQADAASKKIKAKKPSKVTKINTRTGGAMSGDDGDDEISDEEEEEEEGLTPGQERVMDAFLWSASLTMLHFTLDVFVYSQYGMELEWGTVLRHTPPAFLLILFVFWVMHETPANPVFIPFLPHSWQHTLRQAVFAIGSVAAGCYVIHITNSYGYVAIMKQAPICGVFWIWSVIEMDLLWALPTIIIEAIFLKAGRYSIM